MEAEILRITPFLVLPDIGTTLQWYRSLGCDEVSTETPGCVGVVAGKTALVLAAEDYMLQHWRPVHVVRLVGRQIPYIHVTSVETALNRLPPSSVVLENVFHPGLRETLVEHVGGLSILAQKTAH